MPIAETSLVGKMQIYSFAIIFLDLVFNIVIILFVVISILLIYSLLMITTETKTFDVGIMRLAGLSSSGFVAMIATSAVMFVLPSILSAYVCAYPILYVLYNFIFGDGLVDGQISIVPSGNATIEAIGIGLLIPAVSAIIPIQRALNKSLSDSLNTARSTISGTVVTIKSKNI